MNAYAQMVRDCWLADVPLLSALDAVAKLYGYPLPIDAQRIVSAMYGNLDDWFEAACEKHGVPLMG